MRRTVFNFTTAANSAVFKNAGSFLLRFENLFFLVEDHARIPYELKPVINYHLGRGGGRGWVGGFLGITRLSEATEEGSIVANIALKETI